MSKSIKEIEEEQKNNKKIFSTTIIFAIITIILWIIIGIFKVEFIIFKLLFFISFAALSFGVIFSFSIIEERKRKVNSKTRLKYENRGINDYGELVNQFFPEIKEEKELLDILYKKYILIEEALSKGDFDFIKKNCVASLSENLIQQYNDYKERNEKHLMNNFVLCSYNINDITSDNQTITVKMFLHYACVDYILNSDDKLISGDKKDLEHFQYLLEFVIDENKKLVCPNCGAHVSERKCEYCNTVFKDAYYDFVLAKIGIIGNNDRIS